MDHVEQYDYNGYRITIDYDNNPLNPRTECDNIGEILYLANDSNILGDKTADRETMQEIMDDTDNVWLPVHAYIHSGIVLSTESFSFPFDSGQCGIIWVDRKAGQDALGNDDKIKNYLKSEVETYSRYLSGECYHYTVEKAKTCETCDNVEYEIIDNCSGYDDLDYAKSEAEGVTNNVSV